LPVERLKALDRMYNLLSSEFNFFNNEIYLP
jgi:hypothetical protein